jgi:hypothetical protein
MAPTQFERFVSSEIFAEGPTPSRYWGDQWLRVSEKLLKGLNHQLTNRVSSIDAALAMQRDGEPGRELAEAMRGEAARLHELLHLYRALTVEPFEPPEPLRLQDLVPLVVRLHEHHGDLRHIPCEVSGNDNAAPVLVRHAALLRCALVLVASAAGNVLRSGRPAAVVLEFGGDERVTWLRLRGPAPPGQLFFSGEGSLVHAVRAALAHAHASVDGELRRESESDQVQYELQFPSLSASREAEL